MQHTPTTAGTGTNKNDMKTELKDVLHFYLGCEVRRTVNDNLDYEVGVLVGISKSEVEENKTVAIIDTEGSVFAEWYIEETTPILRPLSSMTEDELRNLWEQGGARPDEFIYLLSKSFDLFNLIPNGLAIDKNSLL